MADKRTEPEAPGDRRRKRAAPTIDLTATEVPPAEPQATPEPQPDPAPAAPASEQPATGEAPPASEAQSAEPRAAPPLPLPPPRSGIFLVALAAGIAGAVIMSGVVAALWYGGLLLPPPPPPPSDQGARIAALEQQVKALRNQPPSAPDTKAIDGLRARVDELVGEIAKLPPGDKSVTERLASTDNALKSLGIALTALNHRNDTIAADAQQARTRADAADKAVSDLRASLQDIAKSASGNVPAAALDALQKRVAALDALQKRVDDLDQSVKTAHEALAKASATDKAARLAVSAAALRDAVVAGAPYEAELQETKALGGSEQALASLARFAQSGVPSQTALAHELSALMPALVKAAGTQKPSGGFLDRLQANAGKLVRIEPVEAPKGDMPSDVLARIEVDAAKADIDSALTDLAQLSETARAPAQGWIAKAKARQQALATARQFAAAMARVLARP